MTRREEVLTKLIEQAKENMKLAKENIEKHNKERSALDAALEESGRWIYEIKQMIKDGEFKHTEPTEIEIGDETLDQCECGNQTFERGVCSKCQRKRKIWLVWVTSAKNPGEFRIVAIVSTPEDADKRRKAYNETAIARGQDRRYYSEQALVDHLFGSSFNRGDYY